MYVLSIFWRASQSKHKAFANVELTDEINRYFQNCIKDLIGLDPNAVMIKVAKLKCSRNYYTEEHLRGIITNPVLRKLGENRFSYFMIFSGYYFEIMLYTTPGLKVSEAGVLKKNKRILKVPYIDILSIPEMVKAFLKTRELQKSQQVF
ncbi:hypothetical protein [Acinetobacter tjernbergiae]|uniref:Uncharacterized protein n=1 Tax=Acinetobacter tjernbergiae DSM 14971 = CIP 107465 TaxID=1120928 RepID=V2UWH4_9GAMM|nr:hypothetical protein [Acinetobacter tjernbergiae]ESK54327.1 hypothetical protein F990_02785 [Acinetobacter tjernbergiae DSM 14971 = CIP 107465]